MWGDRSVWVFAGHGHSTAERGQELLPPAQKEPSLDLLPPGRAARGGGCNVLVVPKPFTRIREEGGLHSH